MMGDTTDSQEQAAKPWRFSLRTLFAGITAFGFFFVFGSIAYEHYQWRDVGHDASSQFALIQDWDQPGGYISKSNHGGKIYVVSNQVLKMLPDGSSISFVGSEKRENMIWIWPPGEWAKTPKEALQILKDNL